MRAGRLCTSAPPDLFPGYSTAGIGPGPPVGAATFGGGSSSTGSTKPLLPGGGLLPGFPRTAGARQATRLVGSGEEAWGLGGVGRGGGGDTDGESAGKDEKTGVGDATIAVEKDTCRRGPEQQGDAVERQRGDAARWQQGETAQMSANETAVPATDTSHDGMHEQQDLQQQQRQDGGEGGGGVPRQDRSFVGTRQAATVAERFARYSKEEGDHGTNLSSHPQLDFRHSLLDSHQGQQHRLLAPRFAGDHTLPSSSLVAHQNVNSGETAIAAQLWPRGGTSHLISQNRPATTTAIAAAVSSQGGRGNTSAKNATRRQNACRTAGNSRVNVSRRASSRGARVLLPGEGARNYSSLMKGLDSVRGRELESRVATAEAEVREVEVSNGL